MADLPVSSSSPLGGFEFPVLHSDAGYWDLPLEETNSQTCLNAIPQHQTISAPPIIPSHPTIITSPFGGVGNEVKIKEFVERIRKKVNGSEPTKPVLGLEELQQTIVDAIVAPQKFTIHSDLQVQAILLAGPPGCAKTTMLLQSVILSATRLQKPISYYKLLYSDALSSFVGESEKIIKFLFENAIENQPSVILIDEVDGLMRKRKDEESDHTSRFKSALLTQMQGYTNSSGVVLIATTNLPHTMDEGFQRRFQERFLVRLPTFEERVIIYDYFVSLCENTGKVDWDSFDFKQLSSKSQRFSGDDIRNVVAKALRKKLNKEGTNDQQGIVFTMSDVNCLLSKCKPTCKPEDLRKLEKWGKKMATNYDSSTNHTKTKRWKVTKALKCCVMACCCGNACGA